MNVSPSGDPRERIKGLTKGPSCQRIDFYGQPTTLNKKEKKKKNSLPEEKKNKRKEKKESKGIERKKTAADGYSHHPFNCHMVDLSAYQPIIQEKES
jgi:hypothetical protein